MFDDIYWFGNAYKKGGSRVGTGIAGGNGPRITPYEAFSMSALYDPSETAAAWRLAARIENTDIYEDMMGAADELDGAFKQATREFRTNAEHRFNLAVNYLQQNQDLFPRARQLADLLADRRIKGILLRYNTHVTQEAKYWGINRKILASVLVGTMSKSNMAWLEKTVNWLLTKTGGSSKPSYVPPRYKVFGSTKKTGKGKGKGRGKKRKRT